MKNYTLFHKSKVLPFTLQNKILDSIDLTEFEIDLVPFVKQYFYLNS